MRRIIFTGLLTLFSLHLPIYAQTPAATADSDELDAQRWERSLQVHLQGMKKHEDASSPTGSYIPKDLTDALRELSEVLPMQAVADMGQVTERQMFLYHHGLGTAIRNDWGLWNGSRLARFFNSIGVQHPDDMSSIILISFWRKLHNKPIDVAGQVKKFHIFGHTRMHPSAGINVYDRAPDRWR